MLLAAGMSRPPPFLSCACLHKLVRRSNPNTTVGYLTLRTAILQLTLTLLRVCADFGEAQRLFQGIPDQTLCCVLVGLRLFAVRQ